MPNTTDTVKTIQVPKRYTLELRSFEESTEGVTVHYKTIGTAITPNVAYVEIRSLDPRDDSISRAYPGDVILIEPHKIAQEQEDPDVCHGCKNLRVPLGPAVGFPGPSFRCTRFGEIAPITEQPVPVRTNCKEPVSR